MIGYKRRRKNHNHVSIDYYAYLSHLKEWNASYKAAFSFISLLAVISADTIVFSVMTIIFMGCLTVGVGKIRLCDYVRLLFIPATFIIMGGIAILVQFGDGLESIFRISFFSTKIYITRESLRQCIHLGYKALGAVSCLFMLTLSTPMGEIISVLRRLHVPDLILELMHLIYRYIFILTEMNVSQKDAAQSRLGYCDRKTALQTFGMELANLLVVSMRKANSYYDALEARGFEGGCLFWEEKRKMTMPQVVWGGLYIFLMIIVLAFYN